MSETYKILNQKDFDKLAISLMTTQDIIDQNALFHDALESGRLAERSNEIAERIISIEKSNQDTIYNGMATGLIKNMYNKSESKGKLLAEVHDGIVSLKPNDFADRVFQKIIEKAQPYKSDKN